MTRKRKSRRKQIVPPLTAQQRRLYDAERALAGSDRGHDASKKIQGVYRAHLRKPVVYMKGRDLQYPRPGRQQQDYARYANLRDFLRSEEGSVGVDAVPRYESHKMKYFQKLYTPDDRYGEFVLRSSNWWGTPNPWGDIYEAAGESGAPTFLGLPPEWLPRGKITKLQAKEAIDRRRRKLRDIEGGDIVIRDALFRALPDRGRIGRRWRPGRGPESGILSGGPELTRGGPDQEGPPKKRQRTFAL